MYRVIQWTTGNVGRRALRAIAAHPELELVGVYAHGAEKVGRDAGELCGSGERLGVAASDDPEALLRLRPDCVSYNPLFPDVDQLCRILEAGVNVVTTSAFVTGSGLGAGPRRRIEQAARKGGASIFGSGMNPGFANLLALVSAGVCDRIRHVRVTESVDASGYASAETQRAVGFGHPLETPGLEAMTRRGSAVFADGLELMAEALGLELDEKGFEVEYAAATADQDLGFMQIPRGCVSGIAASWHGLVRGVSALELRVVWKMGRAMEPDWPLEHGYLVEIDGQPRVRTRLQVLPPHESLRSEAELMGLGMVITAMPAVNAIPAVCEAAPGIRTYADLPLVTGAHLLRPFEEDTR